MAGEKEPHHCMDRIRADTACGFDMVWRAGKQLYKYIVSLLSDLRAIGWCVCKSLLLIESRKPMHEPSVYTSAWYECTSSEKFVAENNKG